MRSAKGWRCRFRGPRCRLILQVNSDGTGNEAPAPLALAKAMGIFLATNRPHHVGALPGYRLRLTFPDGVQGVIDLAGDVGRGVFTPLADEAFFRTVHLGQFGQIAWSEDLEICPGAAYHGITHPISTEPVHA